MGHNDHLEDNRPDLPEEAGENTHSGFEPNDEWLKAAKPDLRHEAMRQWFVSRYWDPANDTPYDSGEGGYLYFDGGPFDAEEKLYGRFEKLFPDEVIRAVVDDVESEGTEWAPIHIKSDYDLDFEYEVPARDAPYKTFMERIADVNALVATSEFDSKRQELLRKLLYSSLITALEAYLAELMSYWLKAEKDVFRNFVRNSKEFKGQKISLSSIYDNLDTLQEVVEKYVQSLLWHRLEKVIPLLTVALGIKKPAIEPLMKHIIVRHDIVHRSGKTKDGEDVIITQEKLNELRICVISFIDDIEGKIRQRYPVKI